MGSAMTHPLCDALYRHQAIRWTIAAAKEVGLTLGLYGNGWDAHQEFAPYARGPVAAGDDFRLTRRAAINLQIAPYLCLHQRMLDGICSGAFSLVRHHVTDTEPQGCWTCWKPAADRMRIASTTPGGGFRQRCRSASNSLSWNLAVRLCPMGNEDPIEVIRMWQEAQLLEAGSGVLPHLDEVSFSDSASLRTRLERFAREPEFREQITAAQRQSILGRLTYEAAIARITQRMGQLLSEDRFGHRP